MVASQFLAKEGLTPSSRGACDGDVRPWAPPSWRPSLQLWLLASLRPFDASLPGRGLPEMGKSRGMLHDIYCHLLWCVNEKSARALASLVTIGSILPAALAERAARFGAKPSAVKAFPAGDRSTPLDDNPSVAIAGSSHFPIGSMPHAQYDNEHSSSSVSARGRC